MKGRGKTIGRKPKPIKSRSKKKSRIPIQKIPRKATKKQSKLQNELLEEFNQFYAYDAQLKNVTKKEYKKNYFDARYEEKNETLRKLIKFKKPFLIKHESDAESVLQDTFIAQGIPFLKSKMRKTKRRPFEFDVGYLMIFDFGRGKKLHRTGYTDRGNADRLSDIDDFLSSDGPIQNYIISRIQDYLFRMENAKIFLEGLEIEIKGKKIKFNQKKELKIIEKDKKKKYTEAKAKLKNAKRKRKTGRK